MRKKDFIKTLAQKFPELPEELVIQMSDKIIAQIINALREGGRAEIRGFGTFFFSIRKSRLLRLNNPRAQTTVELPEKRIPRFKAGKTLSKAVDNTT